MLDHGCNRSNTNTNTGAIAKTTRFLFRMEILAERKNARVSILLSCLFHESFFVDPIENTSVASTVFNQLAVFDEYTRGEETTIFCVTMSLVGSKIKK